MGRSQDVWVDQTPKYMAIGEAMSFTMDFADVGTPTSPTVTAYNAAGTDVSSTMLSGSASVSGTIVTLKKFTPSSVQTYRLTVSVTVSGNTVIGALDVVVVSLTPTANIINGYTTRNAVLDLLRVTSTDAPDDSVIDALIAQASRYIDQKTGRTFYPRVETRLYDVPSPMSRELWINDDDLLAVVTLTNGDTTVLTTTDYFLLPRNDYPKYAIVIKESSSVIWETDSNNDSEGAISLAAIYGFRQQYGTRGFVTGANLNEASGLNAADTTFTMVSGANFASGQLIKCENELMYILGVAGADLTVRQRGDNGSTAATHAQSTAVTIWNVEPEIEMACKMLVDQTYRNRFGENLGGTATVTAAGVVITPQDVPALAAEIIHKYTRIV